MRERELGDRLADDGEQSLCPLELDRHRLRPLAGAQRLGCAHGEGREALDVRKRRGCAGRKDELEHAHGRLSERQGRYRATKPVALRLDPDRPRLGKCPLSGLPCQRD